MFTFPFHVPRYTLYIFDVSYYSGKMEGYLRYKEIPYERVEPDWWQMVDVIYPNTGLMKVPAVRTQDGRWLSDSTPMIDWFEKEHPAGAVLPDDPVQAFFCRLVEDYADEWLWRPALHYRWSYRSDALFYSRRFAHEFLRVLPFPKPITALIARQRQSRFYVRGDGVSSKTRAHVEGVYQKNLAWLQALLEKQPFLLGGRPSLADFGYFASMFRHFGIDPTPAGIMRMRAPAVYEWVARLWNARHSAIDGAWPQAGTLPPGWTPILRDIGEAYLPYLHRNACAFRDGEERFDLEIQGVRYRDLPAVPYRVYCRERLQRHYAELPSGSQEAVQALLREHGCLEPLLRDGRIPSHHADGAEPPYCQPRQVGACEKFYRFFVGTHWKLPPRKPA